MARKGGIFRRFFRAVTRPFRARVKVTTTAPPPPPFEPERPTDFGGPEPSGWHLVGYYSPASIHKDNWQNIEAGASWPSDREFHRSPVLTFRLGNTDTYRSFLGPTDASIDEIIAYLNDKYAEDAA